MGGARLIWALIIALFGFIGGSMLVHDWQGSHRLATADKTNGETRAVSSSELAKGAIPTAVTPSYGEASGQASSGQAAGSQASSDQGSSDKTASSSSVWSVPTAVTPNYSGYHENSGTIAKRVAPSFESKSIPGWRIPTDAKALAKFGLPEVSAPFTGFAATKTAAPAVVSVWSVPTAVTPKYSGYHENAGTLAKRIAPSFESKSIPGWRIPTDVKAIAKFGLPPISKPFTGFAATEAAVPTVASVWSVPTAVTPKYSGYHENVGTIAKRIAPSFESKSIPGWRVPTDAAALKKFGLPPKSVPFTGFAKAASDLASKHRDGSTWKVPTAPTPEQAAEKKGVMKKIVDFFKGDDKKVATSDKPKTRSSKSVRDDAQAHLKIGEFSPLGNERIRVTGHAGKAEKILVYMNKAFLGEASIAPDGSWVYETSDPMPKGELNFEVQQVEAGGIVIARTSKVHKKATGGIIIKNPWDVAPPKKKAAANLPPTGVTPSARVISGSDYRGSNKEQLATHQRVGNPAAAGGGDYLVVKGDNLWDIAQKKLGHGKRYWEIYKLNKTDVFDPHFIKPGQKLRLP